MAKVTLQSIADKVGVSRMTVSNAFSRPDQLSAELRERILAAATELGYVGPDPAARALARGRTGSVGLLLNEGVSESFADAVSAELLATVADALNAEGLALTLLAPPRGDGFFPARDVAIDAALVYSCNAETAGIGWLEKRQIPMVTIDENVREGVPAVNIDDRAGARAAAQHLLDLGHTRIGILALQDAEKPGPSTDLSLISDSYPMRERMLGWHDALDAAGVTPEVRLAAYRPLVAAEETGRELLASTDVTAVLCFSDLFAVGLLRAAESLGRSVPGDLSIVGFDDNPASSASRPPLTTVRQDIAEKGRTAVGLLVDTLAGRAREAVRLPTTLVVRDSTAPPA
ncbi:LacI family DNA-binding transcriptional regulator [Nocardioides sp. CER19]|uniref:LacI family DNA-binding transcriptional regulator n=1 Tax=Nocardioides sp. CER19 TaxID=3038538 RepID=UPI00244ACEF5|nr:LacI family DNA-binding transcriptional regulator [Nocardioides sp. CER19]MDH2413021.1 LacI family DNA-binding transcriptional regulator [Nocardioides sp. CER19]